MTKKAPIETLILLAKEGAHLGSVKVSLSWLAGRLGTSRQTAARRLAELEAKGLIVRELGPRGQNVRLSPAGLAALRTFHHELGEILKLRPSSFKLSGRVVPGMGEGSYYMSQPGYLSQFKKELGFTPYPGTLDIKLERESVGLKEVLARLPSKEVAGFKTRERSFGPVKFYPVKFKKSRAALILPLRTHHTDVVELIAPKNLRKTLGLKDGDLVQVEVMP